MTFAVKRIHGEETSVKKRRGPLLNKREKM